MERHRILVVSLCLVCVYAVNVYAVGFTGGTAEPNDPDVSDRRGRGVVVEFAGGTGEPNDPYQIATAAQLISIYETWDASSKHFVLVADIDLDPNLPGGRAFNRSILPLKGGTFDGRSHKILHLHILPGMYDLGIEGVIRNVCFEQVIVEEGDWRGSASAILGRINKGYIINCSVKGGSCGMGLVQINQGYLVNCAVDDASCAMGLTAENQGYILHCSVTAQAGMICGLAGKNSGSILFSHVTGGLAVDGGPVRENSGTISDCYSTADVLGSAEAFDWRRIDMSELLAAGGLVRTNSGTISCCYATGVVSGQLEAGGLVGTNSGTLSYCYATGVVSGKTLAGGLVGSSIGPISDCCAWGAVSVTGTNPYYDYAGGLVGSNGGPISRCYSVGAGGGFLVGSPYGGRGPVLNSYYLSPSGEGGRFNGSGIPLTDIQMRRQESFLGWDFLDSSEDGTFDTWAMPEGGGYPILVGIPGPSPSGSGTAEDPYLIESAGQFRAICRDVGAHYRLIADIDFQGQSLAEPIIPVFWGHLDGNGHTISNFSFTGGKDVGLFGILRADAMITNLNLYNVHVVPPWASIPNLTGVLAVQNDGKIVGCSVRADTTMWQPLGGQKGLRAKSIGGLVAVNGVGGEISRCLVSWTATGSFERGGMPEAYWGGVAGRNMGSIAQCHASTAMTGTVVYGAPLVGQNDGSVVDCYADGYSVRAGLVCTNHGQIAGCYAAVMVASIESWRAGLVAEDIGGTIINSYFLAEADGGGRDNGLGTVHSDAQMKRQASFNGWDFGEVWTICEGTGYPRLRWEGAGCEP